MLTISVSIRCLIQPCLIAPVKLKETITNGLGKSLAFLAGDFRPKISSVDCRISTKNLIGFPMG